MKSLVKKLFHDGKVLSKKLFLNEDILGKIFSLTGIFSVCKNSKQQQKQLQLQP